MSQASPNQRGRYRLHPAAGVEVVTRRRIGDANPRGRMERLQGPFRLRADLSAPGAMALVTALTLVVADWERQVADGTIGTPTPPSTRRCCARSLPCCPVEASRSWRR
jgi:hypothetical protein